MSQYEGLLDEYKTVPSYTITAINDYVEHGAVVGGFLESVLSGDLFHAVSSADSQNFAAFLDIVDYVRFHCPVDSFGNTARVRAWQRHDGLEGYGPYIKEQQDAERG